MKAETDSFPPGRTVARHALGWLVLANAVGVLLAVLLLHPRVGELFGALGYGRWMPVHMNGQLYGWCALPLAGLLLKMYWKDGYDTHTRAVQARVALWGWSLALAAGCAGWLGGTVSGKLFMDWHGWERGLLPLAMLGLWVLVAEWESGPDRPFPGLVRAARLVLLALLFCVPWVFYWATGRGVFPAVNPHSGGATGTALLGSTLGIVMIFGLAPWALELGSAEPAGDEPLVLGEAVDGAALRRGLLSWKFGYWAWAACSLLVFATVDHGDVSHHELSQILSLGLLLGWAPLSWGYLSSFAWPQGARRWLVVGLVSWGLLLLSGWLSFLPGLSERLKFTHALVGHAHLALACHVTAMNWALLICLGARAPGRVSFWFWQAATVLHVGVLLALGWREQRHEAELFVGSPWVQALLSLRLLSGLVMLGVSVVWLISQRRGLKSTVGAVSLRCDPPASHES